MIELVRSELDKLQNDYHRGLEIIRGIDVTVAPTETTCPECCDEMGVQQTRPKRRVATVKYGPLSLRVVTLACNNGCRNSDGKAITRRPEVLSRIVARGSNFGYDVEVYVGLQKYLHQRQREEIQADLLKDYGISISTGRISDLQKKFLQHYAALIDTRVPKLREKLCCEGRYPWWVDATGEFGRGTLFLIRGGWQQWVLGAWKLTSERADQILPCLRYTGDQYGAPVGIMRDLGKAIIPAVVEFAEGLDEQTFIWSCHQHLLKDVGKDLLTDSYDELRSLFRHHDISPDLRSFSREFGRKLGSAAKESREEIEKWSETSIKHDLPKASTGLATLRVWAQWVLDFDNDGDNLRFPFDRPYLDFYNRSFKVRRALDAAVRTKPEDPKVLRAARRLASIIDPTVSDERFQEVTRTLTARAELFDEMRTALRLNPKISGKALEEKRLTEKEKVSFMQDTEKSLKKFIRSIKRRRPKRGPGQDIRDAIDLILDHYDRYGDSLWGHVVPLNNGGIRVVGRTNLPAEGYFNALKHNERRRSGRKNLSQDMEDFPPEAAFVPNLNDPEYVKILCGAIEALPEAFAVLDSEQQQGGVTKQTKIDAVETVSLSRDDRKFVRNKFLEEKLNAAAASRAPKLDLAEFH
jgi:hypothetical protein